MVAPSRRIATSILSETEPRTLNRTQADPKPGPVRSPNRVSDLNQGSAQIPTKRKPKPVTLGEEGAGNPGPFPLRDVAPCALATGARGGRCPMRYVGRAYVWVRRANKPHARSISGLISARLAPTFKSSVAIKARLTVPRVCPGTERRIGINFLWFT